jgi:hypothetical protein
VADVDALAAMDSDDGPEVPDVVVAVVVVAAVTVPVPTCFPADVVIDMENGNSPPLDERGGRPRAAGWG